MALLDFLKNKKDAENSKQKKTEKKSEKVLNVPAEKVEKKKPAAQQPVQHTQKGKAFSYDIVKEPHISEKATNGAEKNQYTFKVYKNANKPEIKKSVEGMYNVNVVAVNVVKIPKKKRRLGGIEGWKKGYRKAIVTIKEGQKIEIF